MSDFALSELDFYKTLFKIQKGLIKSKVLLRREDIDGNVVESWISPCKGQNAGKDFDCVIEVFAVKKEFLGMCYYNSLPDHQDDFAVALDMHRQLYKSSTFTVS